MDEANVTETFELYIIREDLAANPIAENAATLRAQAEVCNITFDTYESASNDNNGWIENVTDSVQGEDCNFTVCSYLSSDCQQMSSTDEDGQQVIEGYQYCDCDVVVGLDQNDHVFLFTVEDKGSETTSIPNDIKLLGLFEFLSGGELDGVKEIDGLPPINSPSNPAEVPRFNTIQDLADRMAQCITSFTGLDTVINVSYSEGTEDVPGSFLFGIEFSKQLTPLDVSFNSSLALGDVAEILVTSSSLVVNAKLSVSNEFGVIFGPDETEELKLTSSPNDGACPSPSSTTEVSLKWTNPSILCPSDLVEDKCTTIVTVTCTGGNTIDDRKQNVKDALVPTGLIEDDGVSLVGDSTLMIKFGPSFSYVEMYLDSTHKDNIFGFKNEIAKKGKYQIANGQASFGVDVDVTGSAEVSANVGGVFEISADIEAGLYGSLAVKAGSAGQLISTSEFLSKIVGLTDPDNAGFVSAKASFDGLLDLSGTVNEPFEIALPSVQGTFKEPYQLDLLAVLVNNTNEASTSIPKPNIELSLDIPDIGALSNLTFKDVIKLLQQALEFLIGDEEGDSVETCSGGLLGTEIGGTPVFTYPIPVVGISACDSASFLKVVVDAVDALVNDCPECSDDDSTENSGTFQVLQTKLELLLQGMSICTLLYYCCLVIHFTYKLFMCLNCRCSLRWCRWHSKCND